MVSDAASKMVKIYNIFIYLSSPVSIILFPYFVRIFLILRFSLNIYDLSSLIFIPSPSHTIKQALLLSLLCTQICKILYLFHSLSINQSINQSINLSIYLSICLSIWLSTYINVFINFLSLYLSQSPLPDVYGYPRSALQLHPLQNSCCPLLRHHCKQDLHPEGKCEVLP